MAFKKKEGLVVETVVFNGYRYNRYPYSNNPAHRRYFARSGHRLHRDVWEYHNGPIPEGHQIHHIDGDTGNNDISNLECVPFKQHRAKHHSDYVVRGKSEKQLEHLRRIQEKAKEWHASVAGREWHRQNAFNSMLKPGAPKPYSKSSYAGECHWCGSSFSAKSPKKLFCSAHCGQKCSRYERGLLGKVHPYYASRLQSDG